MNSKNCLLTNVASALFFVGTIHPSVLGATQVVAWGDFGWTNVPPDLTNAVAIATGVFSSTALKDDGTVVSWDIISDAPSATPSGLTNVVAIASGSQHMLALNGDGSVAVWGNYEVNLGGGGYQRAVDPWVPSNLTNVVAVAGGDSYSLALRADGTVIAWGVDNGLTHVNLPPGLTNAVAIAAGFPLSAALKADGTLVVWSVFRGGEIFGSIPTDLTNAIALAASDSSVAVLQEDGRAFFWDVDTSSLNLLFSSVISNGVATYLETQGANFSPTPLPPNTAAVSSFWEHGLALIADGPPLVVKAPDRTVAQGGVFVLQPNAVGAHPLSYLWQFNGKTVPAETNATLRVAAAQSLQTGVYSVIVSNAFGRATSALTSVLVVPMLITAQPKSQSTFRGSQIDLEVSVAGAGPFSYQWQFKHIDIEGAINNRLAITNVQQQHAGIYSVTIRNSSTKVQSADALLEVGDVAAWGSYYTGASLASGLTNILAVATASAFDFSSVALRSDGAIITWGGGAGIATTRTILDWPNVVGIATGSSDSFLALRSDGTVAHWFSDEILQVQGLSNVVAIAGGGETQNLALRQDGTVAAWLVGWDGNTPTLMAATNQYIPPTGMSNVVAIAAGDSHSLALLRDGSVMAWGDNTAGQIQVPPELSHVVGIAAGFNSSFALKDDGTVVAWGSQTNLPAGLTEVVRIAASSLRGLALRADGTVVAWGNNDLGQTDAPPELVNAAAIAVGWDHGMALIGEGPPAQRGLRLLPRWETGQFTCMTSTESGRVYQLEFKDSLIEPDWQSLPLAAGNGGLVTLTDPSAPLSSRFYRIRRW